MLRRKKREKRKRYSVYVSGKFIPYATGIRTREKAYNIVRKLKERGVLAHVEEE